MSGGRWVRPHKGLSAPVRVVCVAAESRAVDDCEKVRTTRMKLARLFVRSATYRRGRWCQGPAPVFDSGDKFHDWLEQYAPTKRATYVFAPVASNVLTLTGFLGRLSRLGAAWDRAGGPARPASPAAPGGPRYRVRSWVVNGVPDIVRYGVAERTIVWLSGRQYLNLPHSQLELTVGYPGPRPHAGTGVPAVATRTAAEVAGCWLQAVTRLADWWRSVKGGRWGDTVSGLALNYFRSRLADQTVLDHDDESAAELERHAIFGGRASVYYLGDVRATSVAGRTGVQSPPRSSWGVAEGPVTLVDVRSMYPFLLACKPYPVRLAGVIDRPRVRACTDMMETHGVVASVELDARYGEYPRRTDDGITYPVGRFNTVLCGPELEQACKSGEVRQVYRLAYYTMGRPFESMARSLIEMREAYKREGNPGWELFVKLLSNSFAGKLAQRRHRWERRPNVLPEQDWGEWVVAGTSHTARTVYRSIAGMVQERVEDTGKRRTMGQCFAYLTSYGRHYMRTVRGHCPPGSVVSQDTDGLWVLPAGLDALTAAGLLGADAPGTLRVVRSAERARFWGPKHYWTDAGWTLAGLTAGVEWCGGVEFVDRCHANPAHRSPQEPADWVEEYARPVALGAIDPGGSVDALGWVHPFVLVAPVASP